MNRAEQPMSAPSAVDRVASSFQSAGGVARLGVVLCVALATAFSLVYLVQAVVELGDVADTNAEANFDDRELVGANTLSLEQAVLYEARGLIPEDDSFRVVTGPFVQDANELTVPHVEEFARFFLMPRRVAGDAPWVLCYGCDLAAFGDELEVLWRDDSGNAIGRLPS